MLYDLKGSTRSRYNAEVETGAHPLDALATPICGSTRPPPAQRLPVVLLDENLLETMVTRPIFVDSCSKTILESAVWSDSAFLSRRNVMDYSLLAGVDKAQDELVVGIVDYLRQFTFDKQIESAVKASGVLGGGGKVPTVINPRLYRTRFRKAIGQYFNLAPGYQAC